MRFAAVRDISRNNCISEITEITKTYSKKGLQMGKYIWQHRVYD